MRLALNAGREKDSDAASPSSWTDLPGLCCQAAGGHPEWADDLAVAWLLFYSAAHLMDKIQDQDEPDPWWQNLGPGAALSVASGLYFSASAALNQLYLHSVSYTTVAQIAKDFYDCFLVMTSGQYSELTNPFPSLEKYWELAAAKSGTFFALAARSAARLATDNNEKLNNFERYGHHLGLFIQMRDDLDDVRPPAENTAYGQRVEISRSLPVIYALSVLPALDGERLRNSLHKAPEDTRAAEDVIRLLNQSNAALYIMAEMERHRQLALQAIHQAAQTSPAREALENYLWKL